jgi:hypothetical protein
MKMATARRSIAATLCTLCLSGLVACTREQPDASGPPPTTVPIRRLTNAEYAATVADLFPGYALPRQNFVPDAKVLGFLNLSSSQTGSLVRMEQYESAAFAIAQAVTADPTTLTGCDAAAQGEETCVTPYLADLGKRAYRRPLTEAEQQKLLALLARDAGTIDYPARLATVVQALLLSPKFLFRPEIGDRAQEVAQGIPLTSWEMAARLSYFLTGSTPDPELAAAADADQLRSADQLVNQARRLLTSQRAQTNLVRFHLMWLGTDTATAMAKDEKVFPDFTPLLAYYMAKETDQFLRKTLFDNGGTFTELLLADYTYANGPLAAFYGIDGPAGEDEWDRVQLNPAQRRGLLTQASLLATTSKEDRTDPVRRGKFVLNQLLCRSVAPPTPEIVAMFKPLDLSKTAREQFVQHGESAACALCHRVLDPLGLPFEHYDATGRWRDDDRGMALDVTGEIDGLTFNGVPDMARVLSDMPSVRACYVDVWLRLSQGKLSADIDRPYIDWLMTRFTRNTRVVDLIAAIVGSDTFRYRTPAAGAP